VVEVDTGFQREGEEEEEGEEEGKVRWRRGRRGTL